MGTRQRGPTYSTLHKDSPPSEIATQDASNSQKHKCWENFYPDDTYDASARASVIHA